MLYLYHGTDEAKCRSNMRTAIAALTRKVPDASLLRITDESEDVDIALLLGEQGLFHTKQIIVFDQALKNTNIAQSFVDTLAELAASEHVVFVLERELPKTLAKKLPAHAERVEEHHLRAAPVAKENNPFALADALLARDRRALWLTISRALITGARPEELHGSLLWAMKSVVLGYTATDAEAAGMKPYPFRKAQSAQKRYSRKEAFRLFAELVELPHRSRRRSVPLSFSLEHFALSL